MRIRRGLISVCAVLQRLGEVPVAPPNQKTERPVRLVAAAYACAVLLPAVTFLAMQFDRSALADPWVWTFVIMVHLTERAYVHMPNGSRYLLGDSFYVLAFLALPWPHAVLVAIAVCVVQFLSDLDSVGVFLGLEGVATGAAFFLATFGGIELAASVVGGDAGPAATVLLVVGGFVGGRLSDHLVYQPVSALIKRGSIAEAMRQSPSETKTWLMTMGLSVPIALVALYAFRVEPLSIVLLPVSFLLISLLTRQQQSVASMQRELADARRRLGSDPLTGLPHREEVFEQAIQIIADVQRQQVPLSVMIADLDGFKRINDTRGHIVGDKVLVAASRALDQCARERGDVVGRYGGEEFIIVSSGRVPEDALKDADEYRRAVEAALSEFRTTISIGVEHLAPGEVLATSNLQRSDRRRSHDEETAFAVAATFVQASETLAALIERADKAMYEAKRRGKNQVCEWGGQPRLHVAS